MSANGMEKAVARLAKGCPCGKPGTRIAVAADGVAGCVALIGVVKDKLRVIKEVECFQSKLQVVPFRIEGKILEQRNIEVGAPGIIQRIATCSALSQAARCYEHAWIPEHRTEGSHTRVGQVAGS